MQLKKKGKKLAGRTGANTKLYKLCKKIAGNSEQCWWVKQDREREREKDREREREKESEWKKVK